MTTHHEGREDSSVGLDSRRGWPLTSQAIGMLLRVQPYAGIVDVTEEAFAENAATSSS